MSLSLISGTGHYETVIEAVRGAELSVWIATANLKELMVEDGRAAPGRRRSARTTGHQSILAIFEDLSRRGVELHILHAGPPSRPFRAELARRPRLRRSLALRACPRVHMKVVIVDARLLYLGSANWTGAGLGARGAGKRNFEVGVVTGDERMIDEVQALYDHLWRGGECARCRMRAECGAPLDELEQEHSARPARTIRRRERPP